MTTATFLSSRLRSTHDYDKIKEDDLDIFLLILFADKADFYLISDPDTADAEFDTEFD